MTEFSLKIARVYTLTIMGTAVLVCTVSLVASAYFFAGFFNGGRSWIAIMQAFLVCFGLGAMLYLPALVLIFAAQHVRKNDPQSSIGIAAIIISLPLWIYGISGFALKLPYPLLSLSILIYGLLVFGWGVAIVFYARRGNI